MARNGDVMRSDRLKQVMQQIDPNFDERNAGFNRFSKFVIEAGHRGVVLITKLDNGQYEVAPGPGGHAPGAEPAAELPSEVGREDGSVGRARGREDGGRSRRGRRGRGGRDRSGREGAPQRDRMNGAPRADSGRAREERPESGLTLARAFQLMSQALSEFRAPVGQEALRLRMVAMHGREDALLDAARFPRLLRQANDAEVADVRKVGDDDYEISAQAGSTRAAPPAPPAEELQPAPLSPEATQDAGAPGQRDNGQRFGVRFRRGSRAPSRGGEIPLIGVVRIEPPAEQPQANEPVGIAADPETETEPPAESPVKRPRPRRPRKRTAAPAEESAVASTGKAPVEPSAEAAPPKRARTRSRKKPE